MDGRLGEAGGECGEVHLDHRGARGPAAPRRGLLELVAAPLRLGRSARLPPARGRAGLAEQVDDPRVLLGDGVAPEVAQRGQVSLRLEQEAAHLSRAEGRAWRVEGQGQA